MNEDDKKLDWMYKGASGLVDREEYLLGRTVDKTLEQLNNEEKEKKLGIVPPKNHVEHECIPPSIRDYNKVVQAEQVDLSAKLQEDPLVAIKKHEEEARRQFLQNPVQLKKLQEALKAQEIKKKKKKRKKSDSDSDLDRKIVNKLRNLKSNPLVIGAVKKENKKSKESILDTILMHKFNELKDKLTEDDFKDIMEGKMSSSYSSTHSSEDEVKPKLSKGSKHKKKIKRKYTSSESSSSSSETQTLKRISKHTAFDKYKSRKKELVESSSSSDESEKSNKKKYSSNLKNKKIVMKKQSNISEENKRKEEVSNACDRKYKTYPDKSKRRDNTTQENKNYQYQESRRHYQDDSSDDKYRTKKSEGKYNSQINSNKTDRKNFDKKRCNSTEEDRKYRKNQKGSQENVRKYKSSYRRRDSSSEHERKKEKSVKYSDISKRTHDGQKCSKSENYKSYEGNRQSSSTESESNSKTLHPADGIKESSKSINQAPENDLDAMILQKLRSLRDNKPTVNIKTNNEESSESSNDGKYSQKVYTHYDSENDEPLYKKKNFGLVRADGTRIALNRKSTDIKKVEIKKIEPVKKQEKKHVKKLTEVEKEKLRLQMMKEPEIREKERSTNLKRYREENKEEENKEFDRNFVHNELLKSTNDASVETRIKSKLNNIQRSSMHMSSNFSKRS